MHKFDVFHEIENVSDKEKCLICVSTRHFSESPNPEGRHAQFKRNYWDVW